MKTKEEVECVKRYVIVPCLLLYFSILTASGLDFSSAPSTSGKKVHLIAHLARDMANLIGDAGGEENLNRTVEGVSFNVRPFYDQDKDCIGAAYVSDEMIIVTHRGTTFKKDARTDFDFKLVPFDLGGNAHRGFYQSVESFYASLKGIVETLLVANPQAEVFFTGHSMGGALCLLSAAKFAHCQGNKLKTNQLKVFQFASPRTGDDDFLESVGKLIPLYNIVHFYCVGDCVTGVPFSSPNGYFRSLGISIEMRPLERTGSPSGRIPLHSVDPDLVSYAYEYFLRKRDLGYSLEESGRASVLSQNRNRLLSWIVRKFG